MEENKVITKDSKQIKPTFLKKAGSITLYDGVDPCDVIFFHGRKNVQLAKINNNEYDIYINE